MMQLGVIDCLQVNDVHTPCIAAPAFTIRAEQAGGAARVEMSVLKTLTVAYREREEK